MFFGAIISCASEIPIGRVLWRNPVDTFLMPFQIIVSTETTGFPWAIRFLALKRLRMTEDMFSGNSSKFAGCQIFENSYLCSD